MPECYQYWRGHQRDEEFDQNGERRAQHNKIHPDVAQTLPSLYLYHPYGRIMAAPERADTPQETISTKAQLLQDTGIFLVRDKNSGFREHTHLALKEAQWAFGCVEVGYDPDFLDSPLADRPPLKEGEDTPTSTPTKDSAGLTVGEGSDLASLKKEYKRLKKNLMRETFYVKHIPARQVIVSSSDRCILEENDWVGYIDEYALEDVKRAPAYKNTEDLKASQGLEANERLGSEDRVSLVRLWDLRSRIKWVFALGHDKPLFWKKFKRCPLKFLRLDLDPNHFRPIPPIFLKLSSQDGYNDSAEYMRKMRIGTVPRYTYDEDAVNAEEAAKFQSRDMNVMVPRKAGTVNPIEPVQQPSTSQGAIQTLALSEKEFMQADSLTGDPLSPPTQTATRAVIANAKLSAQDSFQRNIVAEWLASIIEELLLLAIDYMSLEKWIAVNVDLDSPAAFDAAAEVAKTYQMIDAERLRDATLGIKWGVEVEADSLSPVSEAERGMKLMQVVNFIKDPPTAALLSKAPALLKRLLTLANIRNGGDIDAVEQALAAVVAMNQQMMMMTGKGPGVGSAPMPGSSAGPVIAPPSPPVAPMPVPPGMPGA